MRVQMKAERKMTRVFSNTQIIPTTKKKKNYRKE